jgi:protein required for attachment to host cells
MENPMMLAKGTTVAVADGEKLNLFRNEGDESALKLTALPRQSVDDERGTSGGHQSSSGNPDPGQGKEDGFAAGVVAYLNKGVLDGEINGLVIIAAPRALGEMRKHYHKALTAQLQGEVAKDLTGHSMSDVEKTVLAA